MNNVPWTSPTLWAALVTLLASLGQLIGIAISPEDQATGAAILTSLATGIAGLVVLVRRYRPRS